MARRYFILEKAASYGIKLPQVGHKNFVRDMVYPVDDAWIGEILGANPNFVETDADGYPLNQGTPQEIAAAEALTYAKLSAPEPEPEVAAPVSDGKSPRYTPDQGQIAAAKKAQIEREKAASKKKTTKKKTTKKTAAKKEEAPKADSAAAEASAPAESDSATE